MAELGVQAIVDLATTGKKPAVSEGLDFYNTGVALVTDKPADGVESASTLGRRREDLLGLTQLPPPRAPGRPRAAAAPLRPGSDAIATTVQLD